MLQVFNRNTKYLQKERAAVNIEDSRKVDYLRDEVAIRLCERLLVRPAPIPISFPIYSYSNLISTTKGYFPTFPFRSRVWRLRLQYSASSMPS